MPVLTITPLNGGRPFIVDFDPSKESQEDVEHKYGVSFSEYHEDRLRAQGALDMLKSDSF